jgi:hypothetical protein
LYHQFELYVDKYARQKQRAPELELRNFFGQALHFFVINIPASATHNIQAETFIYAAIHQVKISESSTSHCQIDYYRDFGRTDIVDLNQVQCIVGRIQDRGKWAIVDRSGSKLPAH